MRQFGKLDVKANRSGSKGFEGWKHYASTLLTAPYTHVHDGNSGVPAQPCRNLNTNLQIRPEPAMANLAQNGN